MSQTSNMVTSRLPPDLIEKLDRAAHDSRRSRSWVNKEALENYLSGPRSQSVSLMSYAGAGVVVSRLTFLECVYGPSKAGSTALVEMYRSMLTDNPAIRLVEMTHDILESALLSGGKLGLKLQDAIHYFTALHLGCNLIVTDDRRFKSTPSMRVEYLAAKH